MLVGDFGSDCSLWMYLIWVMFDVELLFGRNYM